MRRSIRLLFRLNLKRLLMCLVLSSLVMISCPGVGLAEIQALKYRNQPGVWMTEPDYLDLINEYKVVEDRATKAEKALAVAYDDYAKLRDANAKLQDAYATVVAKGDSVIDSQNTELHLAKQEIDVLKSQVSSLRVELAIYRTTTYGALLAFGIYAATN